jgi:hypothetical protein
LPYIWADRKQPVTPRLRRLPATSILAPHRQQHPQRPTTCPVYRNELRPTLRVYAQRGATGQIPRGSFGPGRARWAAKPLGNDGRCRQAGRSGAVPTRRGGDATGVPRPVWTTAPSVDGVGGRGDGDGRGGAGVVFGRASPGCAPLPVPRPGRGGIVPLHLPRGERRPRNRPPRGRACGARSDGGPQAAGSPPATVGPKQPTPPRTVHVRDGRQRHTGTPWP